MSVSQSGSQSPGHTPSCPHSADRVCPPGEWPLCVPHPPLAHVRVHDQLHPQAKAPAREVHDEQRAGELHHPAGARLAGGSVGTGLASWRSPVCPASAVTESCSLPPCPRRWSRVGTRRRPCWSLLLSLKCPPVSMGHSTTSTSLSKTSMPLTSTGCKSDLLRTPACLVSLGVGWGDLPTHGFLQAGTGLPPWPQHTHSLPLFCALLERRGLHGGVACLGTEPHR